MKEPDYENLTNHAKWTIKESRMGYRLLKKLRFFSKDEVRLLIKFRFKIISSG